MRYVVGPVQPVEVTEFVVSERIWVPAGVKSTEMRFPGQAYVKCHVDAIVLRAGDLEPSGESAQGLRI